MMPRKLTPEVVARIKAVEAERRSIPTRDELARELEISKSLVDQVASGRHRYKEVPRETPTLLEIVSLQMSE